MCCLLTHVYLILPLTQSDPSVVAYSHMSTSSFYSRSLTRVLLLTHTRLPVLFHSITQSDPQRVLLPTESSMGVDDRDGKAFKDVNGYTVDQLYKDQRFKVGLECS